MLDLMRSRRSIRAFLQRDVSNELLRELLDVARRAPSGGNLQPGHFLRLQGVARAGLSGALLEAWRNGEREQEEYDYFPSPMPRLLKLRQVASAKALYDALGVEREDRATRNACFERNFNFFDAPVAMLVTLDRSFGSGGFMDLGMALYGLMLAARTVGLDSCAIGAMASYPTIIKRHLSLSEDRVVVCGLAMGYADPEAAINTCMTARCEVKDYFEVMEELASPASR